jgi:choline dehydrogenase-like flavoprotein
MAPVVVVGSGPSGVHFALTLLQKGYPVTMLDVGYEGPVPVNPDDTLRQLKKNLDDPASYFLGESYESVLLPDDRKEYYGIPPSKGYVFRSPRGFAYRSKGFEPLFSFAGGGLAEVWTGGSYPFNDAELADFPFGPGELQQYYSEVGRRIGIAGTRDDLTRFLPPHKDMLEPLELDEHSSVLMRRYAKHKGELNRMGFYFGRTRIATLSQDQGQRKKCGYMGRCLWGCPNEALYTPAITLRECREHPNFTYVPGMRVTHFKVGAGNRITSVVAEPIEGGTAREFAVAKLALAAGALGSSKIFLDSVRRHTGQVARLTGLMDNRQVLVPFLNLRLIGHQYNQDTYQYHQLGIGIETGVAKEYVHALVTTLKTASMHPIVENLPCDMKTAIFLVRNLHCGLGIINVNFHDTRREENFVTLDVDERTGDTRLAIQYEAAAAQQGHVERALNTLRKSLWRLGCIVAPGMSHIRPMGASAHYAGTLPMSAEKRPYTVSRHCQSHDFENLFLVDGATFPFLPAKNITFTLMANAVRVAAEAF